MSVVFDSVTPANSKIFVDGIDETLSTNTLTSTIDSTVNDYYLASNGSSLYFDGTVDQFSINSATELLTQHITWTNNEVLPNGIFSNIVKLLNFDKDPYYDRVNSTFGALDTVNPVVSNKSIKISALTYGLIVNDNTIMNDVIANPFTVNCLFKTDDVSGTKVIFGKLNTAATASFGLHRNGDDFWCYCYQGGSGKVVIAANTIKANEWMFVSVVWDGVDSKVYLNGIDETTFNNITTQPDITSSPYQFGRSQSDFSSFDGDIAFVQMIDKAITPTEALEVANGGNPLSVSETSFAGNLVFEMKAEDLHYDGQRFRYTDLVSGQEIYSRFVSMDETFLTYNTQNVVVSRNLTEFDKECNGVISKGEIIDLIFTSGQSNDYGAEGLPSLPSEYNGTRNDLKRWDGSSFVDIDLLASISNPEVVPGTYAYQPSMINKFVANSGRDLLLHSYSVSATRLGEDTGNDWNTLSSGEYFDLSETERNTALALYSQNDINIVCEVWNQNEQDCTNETWANAYETNLTNYINKRRETFPNLKFIIVLVHADLPIGSFPYKATVLAAQLSVAAALDNVITINQDSFSSQVDNVHRDAAGYEDLGNAIYEQIKIN